MIELTTTLGGRALALTSSLLFHAGAVVAIGGHGPDMPVARSAEAVLVDFVTSPEPVIEAVALAPTSLPRRSGQLHAHTHDYPVAHQHDARAHDPALVHAPVGIAAAPPVFALSVPTSDRAAPQFALRVGSQTASGVASSPVRASEGAGRVDGEPAAEPAAEAGVDTPARLLSGVTPPYPRAAAEASIEADVPLEIVVDTTGHVVSARVLAPVGYGLDLAAVRGMRGFHFKPAVLRGRPTAVRMKWTMLFRLQ